MLNVQVLGFREKPFGNHRNRCWLFVKVRLTNATSCPTEVSPYLFKVTNRFGHDFLPVPLEIDGVEPLADFVLHPEQAVSGHLIFSVPYDEGPFTLWFDCLNEPPRPLETFSPRIHKAHAQEGVP